MFHRRSPVHAVALVVAALATTAGPAAAQSSPEYVKGTVHSTTRVVEGPDYEKGTVHSTTRVAEGPEYVKGTHPTTVRTPPKPTKGVLTFKPRSDAQEAALAFLRTYAPAAYKQIMAQLAKP